MNVTHVSDDAIPTPTNGMDRLELIFGRQSELMQKYEHIEENNGLLLTAAVPVDIHNKKGQARLKDFAWRVTEELTEATIAMVYHEDKTHFIEELSDAFHFLVELNILSGFSAGVFYHQAMLELTGITAPSDIECRLIELMAQIRVSKGTATNIRARTYEVVEHLGGAMNCLKNKAWKTTHMLTDTMAYDGHLTRANLAFLDLALTAGLDADALYRIYFKKSEVNKFRQRSGY